MPKLLNQINTGKPAQTGNKIHQMDNTGHGIKLHFQSWRRNRDARFTIPNIQKMHFKYPWVNIGEEAHDHGKDQTHSCEVYGGG